MRTPVGILKAWLRTRGFGVHSPFAFRFIREVLFQPFAYYAYGEIESSIRRDAENDMKRLYRILLYFRPEKIIVEDVDNDLKLIKNLVVNDIGGKGNVRVNLAEVVSGEGESISNDADVYVLYGSVGKLFPVLKKKFDARGNGMLFYGKRMAVGVADARLPRQDFSLPI